MAVISREMMAYCDPKAVSREVLVLIDEMEGLLGDKVLNYAARGAR